MRLLALDGSLARASAALLADGAVLAEASRDGARGQPAALPALAAEVLAASPGGGAGPDAVAVTVGPGGFTGLRAAIALARGLAAGWGVPVLGVTTGEALSAALPPWQAEGREAWSVTRAGRGGIVLERPGRAPALLEEEGALPAPGGPVVLVGDAAAAAAARLRARGADVLLSDSRLPAAGAVAVAASRALAAGTPRAAEPLYAEPLALRDPAP